VAPAVARAPPTIPARITRGKRISRIIVSQTDVQVGVILTGGNLESMMLDVVESGILTVSTVIASGVSLAEI
jgi:hypothetical protein